MLSLSTAVKVVDFCEPVHMDGTSHRPHSISFELEDARHLIVVHNIR